MFCSPIDDGFADDGELVLFGHVGRKVDVDGNRLVGQQCAEAVVGSNHYKLH